MNLRLLKSFVLPLILGYLAPVAVAQSITIAPAFDPRTPTSDEDGEPIGLPTSFDAVSADGRTIVGRANEFDRIDIIGAGDQHVRTKPVVFRWRDGVYTKLPFVHSDDIYNHSDPKLLGISADGNRIYGVTDTASNQENPPVSVWEDGALTPGAFGPWIEFIPGFQGRATPVGGWMGRSLNDHQNVRAVSADFSTFVGSELSLSQSERTPKVWTAEGVTTIAPIAGFSNGEAFGVSANGRVVCGYFYGHDDEDTGEGAFVWTKDSGTALIRDLVRDHGFPFEDNFPSIVAQAVSGDGGTVVGAVDGVDGIGRLYGFRQVLGPTLSIRLPGGAYSVGEPFEAEVTVFSPTQHSQTISFPEGLLRSVEGKSDLEFAEGDDPVATFTLTQANPTKTFTVTVIPNEFGSLALTTDVIAVSSKGTLNLNATEKFYITPLKVTVRMLPLIDGVPILNVELDEDGKITVEGASEQAPRVEVTPKVELTIENLSTTPVRATLQGLDPRARDRSTALGRINTLGEFPVDFEAILQGVPAKREFDLEINEDGRFEFVALVTAVEMGGSHRFTAVGRGAPLAVGEPYPVRLEIKMVRTPAITNQNNGAIFVKPGSDVQFLAIVENLTTNATVKFYGITAEKHFNVQGGTLTSDEGNLSDPPFPHDHAVESGSAAVLSGHVKVDQSGVPTGTLTWQGLEDIILVDDETGEETELEMDDVLVESTVTGWLGNDLSLRVIQDFSQAPAPELTDLELASLRLGYYSYGALVGAGKWSYDSLDAIGGLGRFAGNIAGNPSALADAWGEGSRVVWEMGEYAARTWNGMSAADREEFVLSFTAEVQRRAFLLATARSPFKAEDGEAALEFTRNATYVFFNGTEAAYASNDPAQIAQMWGSVSSNIALEVGTALIPSPKFQEYSKAAEAALLATNLDAARLITKQDNLLRTLKSGIVSAEIVLKGWGIGGKHLQDIQTVFRKFKVIGYLRERSPQAFRLIDQLGEAVWKPELMKPKGLSEIDFLILEDVSSLPKVLGRNGEELGLDGITAIFLPDADDVIAARARSRLIARGDYPLESVEEAVEACLARAQHRREEFAEYLPEFQTWKADTVVNNGGIPVARNYADNGVPNPDGFKDATRRFDFERHDIASGQMYIPKMSDSEGIYRYISGDIDWIHFTFLDGSPLDPKTARALYDALFRCCGLQHPETISWIRDGMTVFKGKVNQISEYLFGGKPLLEVSGESTRAVHINVKLSRLAKDGRNHLLFFEGGIKARTKATLADIESALAYFQKRFPVKLVLLPFLQMNKFNEALNRAGAADGQWTYSSTDNDSVLLREGSGGEYQIFDGVKWIPWNPAPGARRGPRDHGNDPSLHLVPTSSLAEIAPAGATQINIFDLPAQWPDELQGHVSNWFAQGQMIVIAPGELTQEIHTVSSIAPMTLSAALRYEHPENTMVAVVPAGITIANISDTASPLIATVIDSQRGTVNLIWQSLPGSQYTLEVATAASPDAWSPVLAEISSTEEVLTLEISLADYDETSSYRLRNTTATTPVTDFRIISVSTDPFASTATLTWTSTTGTEYAVETSENLANGSWRRLSPTVTAASQTATLALPIDPAADEKFYRIREIGTSP